VVKNRGIFYPVYIVLSVEKDLPPTPVKKNFMISLGKEEKQEGSGIVTAGKGEKQTGKAL
jgi:hypothetical protein